MHPSTSTSTSSLDALQHCLSLAQDVANHQEANSAYAALRDRLQSDDPQAVELFDVMWREVLASRRSAMFWEELCNVEKGLTDRMAESHLQLRQNYLRLIQEQ